MARAPGAQKAGAQKAGAQKAGGRRSLTAERAIGARAFASLWRSAIAWALVFALSAASSALTYISSFPTEASRAQLAATTGADAGLAVLLGPVSGIGTVGGYTVYKCFAFLTTLGALWAVTATTRVLRGEEDSGRWQMLLAGRTTARRATSAVLFAVFASVCMLFAITSMVMLAVARDDRTGFATGETLLYASSLSVAPLVFAALGAVAAQLASTRRVANGLGMGSVAVLFVIRMLADSGSSLRWMAWLSPFGWVERMAPFSDNDARPLSLAMGMSLALGSLAVHLAAGRDSGAGVIRPRDHAVMRQFGLRSPLGFVLRSESMTALGWLVGCWAMGISFGLIAKMTNAPIPSSMNETLDRFGVHGSFADQYFSVAFLLVATIVALVPAGVIGAFTDDETSGRVVHLLGGQVTRTRLIVARTIVASVVIVAAALSSGAAMWVGARSQGIDPGLRSMIGAGLNVIPTALLALAIGSLGAAIAPRIAGRAVYAVVSASLMVDLVGSLVSGQRWLTRCSLFHYMALAPGQDVDVRTACIVTATALLLGAVSVVWFSHRDLRPA